MRLDRVQHKGMPGHLIVSRRCCFRLHSLIDGRWKVSTVGCYHPSSLKERPSYENRETIGCDRLYETMVFDETRGDWQELDMAAYNREEDAERGHFEMVEKWLGKSAPTKRSE